MKNKITTACLVITGILSTFLALGSMWAYELGNITGLQFFWQFVTVILLMLLVVICAFYRALLNDYIEVCEDFNNYLDVEEAEEVIIPDEVFEFIRTPELDERSNNNV